MSVKTILVLCAQALLAQCVFSQCTNRAAFDASGIAGTYGWAGPGLAAPAYGSALAYDGLAAPLGYSGLSNLAGNRWASEGLYPTVASALDFTPTTGGGFAVSSGSAIPPTGISVVSDNAFEGILEVVGELPFVGSTTVDGVLATYGSGAINHGCGNGINAMTALSVTSTPASVATASVLEAPVIAAPVLASPVLAAPAFAAPALAYDGLAYGAVYACDGLAYASPLEGIEITPTSGGSLPVSSGSAVAPTGIIVNSETAYEGPLAVAGELPFVGSVAMEGVLPTAGAGAVNHACGNGINAMVSENTAFAPGYASAMYGPAAGISPVAGIAPFGGIAPAAGIAPLAGIAPGMGCANRWAGRGYGYAY